MTMDQIHGTQQGHKLSLYKKETSNVPSLKRHQRLHTHTDRKTTPKLCFRVNDESSSKIKFIIEI